MARTVHRDGFRRSHAAPHLTIAIAAAGLAIACANSPGDNDRRAQAGGDRGTNERISLQGCVEAAPGTNAYVLRKASELAPAAQPQGQERMGREPLVPRGSWVRLVAGNDDLKGYLGRRVTITGAVRDKGTNTIGTAGQSSPMPRAGEANGNAPQIAVERVAAAEGTCEQLPGDTGRPTGGR
jgi:hypothetical protein